MPALRPPDVWKSDFTAHALAFLPYAHLIAQLPKERFPTLEELNQLSPSIPHPRTGQAVRFVAQDYHPVDFWAHYEPRIFAYGEIQTRSENWHDYFHALVWKNFPNAKLALNARHLHEQGSRQDGQRNRTQQALTQFDECGALFITSHERWIHHLQQHNWEALFLQERSAWENEIRVIIFGHATLEQLGQPFMGLTAKAWPCLVPPPVIQAPLTILDTVLATHLADLTQWQTPRDLLPLPILGIPHWHPDNATPAFYQQTTYFRPAKR